MPRTKPLYVCKEHSDIHKNNFYQKDLLMNYCMVISKHLKNSWIRIGINLNMIAYSLNICKLKTPKTIIFSESISMSLTYINQR
jgi:hypothetical protein